MSLFCGCGLPQQRPSPLQGGMQEKFIAETEQWINPSGMLDAYWAKTGERSYCFVGLWDSEASLIAAGRR